MQSNKYDRQLRLWGAHGQARLASAHVALVNASASGTESLKNLVLPGVGRFTVLDAQPVTEADLANNFFVTREWLGKPRAEATCALLCELNPDVQGAAVVEDGAMRAARNPRSFAAYTLVIATQLNEAALLDVAAACAQCSIPLVVARTNGLLGHVRVWCHEHCVVESKPSPEPQEDLRVFNPWPQLRATADAVALEKLDEQEFGHTAFVIVLIKALDAWRAAHSGKAPTGMKEKEAFLASIRAMSREGYGAEENLVEAVDKAFLCYSERPVPQAVQDLLSDSAASTLTAASPNFWILVNALAGFVAQHKVLPLSGVLPDMKSTTASYIALQRVYRAKAMDDLAEVSRAVDVALAQLGRPSSSISAEERALFCANAYHVCVDRYTSLADEFAPRASTTQAVAEAVMDGVGDSTPQSPMVWYLCWRAFDATQGKSADAILAKAKQLCATYQIDPALVSASHAKEMVRFAGCEPHAIAALVGGIASQEAVKLITGQYIPLNNTFVYNGIAGVGAQYRL